MLSLFSLFRQLFVISNSLPIHAFGRFSLVAYKQLNCLWITHSQWKVQFIVAFWRQHENSKILNAHCCQLFHKRENNKDKTQQLNSVIKKNVFRFVQRRLVRASTICSRYVKIHIVCIFFTIIIIFPTSDAYERLDNYIIFFLLLVQTQNNNMKSNIWNCLSCCRFVESIKKFLNHFSYGFDLLLWNYFIFCISNMENDSICVHQWLNVRGTRMKKKNIARVTNIGNSLTNFVHFWYVELELDCIYCGKTNCNKKIYLFLFRNSRTHNVANGIFALVFILGLCDMISEKKKCFI